MKWLLLLTISFMVSCSSSEILYIGTYTNPNNKSEGIYVTQFNNKNGRISLLSNTSGLQNPSYLTLSNNKQHLYCVNENSENGAVSALSIGKKGELSFINDQPAEGQWPCHIALDKTNKFAVIANYGSGNITVFPVNADGSLGAATQTVQHGTSKKDAEPHAHQVTFNKNNNVMYVVDLGMDSLYAYAFDAGNNLPVGNAKTYGLPKGTGPRHLVLSPQENFLYLLNERAASVTVFSMANDNVLTEIQTIENGAVDAVDGNKGSAAIRISPDGKFVYASNRVNTNSISIFSVDADGKLTRLENVPTDKHPRDFNISPDGKWLLVAARDDNSVKVYRRDKQTGLIAFSGNEVNFPSPVALVFL